MGGLSIWHLLIVAIVALLIFGKRLPDVARALGQSVIEFKKGLNSPPEETHPPAAPAAPAPPTNAPSKTDNPPPPPHG